jgi:hypothetical protein
MADSSKQVGMDTDGGGAAAAAVDGQNLPVLVTNRKRELTLEGKALPVDCSGRRRIDLEKDLCKYIIILFIFFLICSSD